MTLPILLLTTQAVLLGIAVGMVIYARRLAAKNKAQALKPAVTARPSVPYRATIRAEDMADAIVHSAGELAGRAPDLRGFFLVIFNADGSSTIRTIRRDMSWLEIHTGTVHGLHRMWEEA